MSKFFQVSDSAKNEIVENIEKADSGYYKSIVMSHAVLSDIINDLTEDEIESLLSLPKEKLNVNVGFSLWDVIKTAFGK